MDLAGSTACAFEESKLTSFVSSKMIQMVPCASPNTDYVLFVIFLGQVTMLSALNLLSGPKNLFFVFESSLVFSIDDTTEVQPQEDYRVVSLAIRAS